MNFKSLPQLLDFFKEEKDCIKYYEKLRWDGKPVCPHCGASNPYKLRINYKCSDSKCYKKFSVKVGTIFENSKLPMRIWFAAIFLATAHKRGISSIQLGIDLNITQKTAWFMLHRIRLMLAAQAPQMIGEDKTVEVDEAYIGGKERNRHKGKKRNHLIPELANDGTKYNKKKVVVGIIERNGKVILKHISQALLEHIAPTVRANVKRGARLISDEHYAYSTMSYSFDHSTVNHSIKMYVDGDKHTNTIENFWSQLKRGIFGTYYQVSEKHLHRYLSEFAARFNNRHVSVYLCFDDYLKSTKGGLLYKQLIAKN